NFVCAQSDQERLILPRTNDLVPFVGQNQLGKFQETADATELKAAGMKEYSLGHFADAVRLLQNAVTVTVQANDTYHAGLIHNDLGDIYQDEYELTKAEQEFKNAIHLLRQQPEHPHALAVTLANFGGMLCKARRYSEASSFISEASKLVKDNSI